ncbi:type VII secretion-associated protein [Mycobacterium sp. HUMS_1102779]|uniref:type VII secretion-associated protein n=1 Tax=Mycobacterium sp. HUMS_1102779 TaxID=3383487 RepID=UPI00389A2FFA
MSAHLAIIEAGPGTVRRLCCAADGSAATKVTAAALGAIDDPVALVGERPVGVDALWRAALRSALCPEAGEALVLVHPSWWSPARIGVVSAAAGTLAADVRARPRSWLLARAATGAAAVVEITERLVVITGAEVVAIPRATRRHRLAEEVAAVLAGTTGTVVLDAPGGVTGAAALAKSIAEAARGGGRAVVHVDDVRLARLARSIEPAPARAPRNRVARSGGGSGPRARLRAGFTAAAVVLAAAAPAVAPGGRHAATPAPAAAPTLLVEGRVALSVPAGWPARRVVAGPGSARVQVTSPSDPEVALHITQSPVPGEALSGAAERLKRAIDAEPAAVFVDFDPSGTSAGRPAVTYREVRADHHVRWTVLLDGEVRISVGCQSRPGGYDAVRDVCERAVRSAHAIG